MATENTSSFEALVNLCYQLRHENEELMEAVNLKSVVADTCDREMAILREKLKSISDKRSCEIEQAMEERSVISEERLRLLQENTRMEEKLRDSEMRVNALTAELSAVRDQVEILLTQLGGENDVVKKLKSNPNDEFVKLEAENDRLRRELETSQMLLVSNTLDPISSPKKPRIDPDAEDSIAATSVFTASSEDSLFRLFESLVGYSAVQSAEDTVTLVSTLDREVSFRFRVCGEKISLISGEKADESALGLLKTLNSVPAFLAKSVLIETTNQIFSV
jgi:hypothetical protein